MVNPRPAINVLAFLQPTVLGRLGSELLEKLASHARVEHYEVPTLLNAAGKPLEWLRLVVEGQIEIVARRASGKEVSVSDVGPGAWATWLPAPADHDLCAAADSYFIALPVAEVRRCCALRPEIYPWIMQDIGQRLRLLMEWTSQSVLVGPEQRMAKLIHILARDQKIGGSSGTLQVTQVRLAALARCSRQSANTLLGTLEKRGLIHLTYGKCEIIDMARLAAFADHEDSD
jgi:CRP/FNR family transcriptional regulator, cyclic AMP receptor protein